MISVIILATNYKHNTDKIRENLSTSTTPIEVIIVVSKDRIGNTLKRYPSEKIITSEVKGRGFACYAGLQLARGDVIVFLHADTILPARWNELILKTLTDKKVVGGAFSLTFNKNHIYLSILIFLSEVLFRITGELWGDRTIFFRSHILKDHAGLLNVPIMEDVRLTLFMKKRGKVALLKEKVTTSSESFFKHGLLQHTFRIIKCRIWYALGGNLGKIYSYYYS